MTSALIPRDNRQSKTRSVPVSSGRIAIAWDDLDTGPLPWLVLSNSLAADHHMWDGQIAPLARAYRVLRYDTRGHGASDAPAGPLRSSDLVDDVLCIMDHLQIGQAAFMGLSLGGMTGLLAALDYPDRITHLICCDARATMPPAARAGWDERQSAARQRGMNAVLADTLDRWLMPETRAARPEVEAAARSMILGTSVEGYSACIDAIQQFDLMTRLQDLSVPTLYVTGDHDTGAPPEIMQAMAAATPGSRLAFVRNAAHLSNLDNPDGFSACLRPFLGI